MGVGTQPQKMEQVVQINLPVPLRIDIGGQVHPRQFARKTLLAILRQHRLVMVIAAHRVVAQHVEHALRLVALQQLAPALIVDRRLRRQMFGRRDIKLPLEDRVTRRIFVHIGGAVADPLAGNEHRQLDVKLDLAHLERRRVPVPHQIPDQPFVILHGFGAAPIADAGGLGDGSIVAHIVDDPDQPVVKNRVRGVKMTLHPVGRGAQGRPGLAARFGNFGLLIWGEGHRKVLTQSNR